MKKTLNFLSVVLLCAVSLYAQVPYYGTPFFKQGFDTDDIASTNWVQSGIKYSTSGNNSTGTAWSTTNQYTPPFKNFKTADPDNTYSLLCTIEKNAGLIDSITSPVIANTIDEQICVGFSVLSIEEAFPTGYGYMEFQISKDDGATWATMWNSKNDATGFEYIETLIPANTRWKTVQVNLPKAYNGQDFKLRFCVNSPDIREEKAMELMIDAVFASKRRNMDAKLIIVNNFKLKNDAGFDYINKGAFFEEPVTIKFINEGIDPIASIDVGYAVQVDDMTKQSINETYSLATPVQYGDTGTYTFTAKALLEDKRTTYKLAVWTALNGEEYKDDDSLSYTVENVMTDVPYKAEWLKISGVPADEWQVVQANTGTGYPTWTQANFNNIMASVCNASNASFDANSYYFSRPVFFEAGKTYELKFTTATDSGEDTDTNAMRVFWTDRLDTAARIGDYLFNKANINNNPLTQTYFVTPDKDTAYYFVFQALCKAANKPLYIYDVSVREVRDIDAQIISLQSPVNKTYRYTDSETVSVTLGNAGLQPVAGEAVKVYYIFESNPPVEETIEQALTVGQSVEYTFAAKVNMEALKTYSIKIGVKLDGDEVAYNDELTVNISPQVVELPYNASLGTNMNDRTYEEEYWTSIDSKWNVSAIASDVRWLYGGNTGNPAKTIAALFSRPVHIAKDTVCELNYSVARSAANTDVPFKVGVYKKNGSTYELIEILNEFVITTANNEYTKYTNTFISTADGDYYFGYIVDPTGIELGLRCNVLLKEINFSKKEVDIMQYGDAAKPVIVSKEIFEAGSPKMALLNDGSIFVSYWSTGNNSKYDLYAQLLNQQGIKQWAEPKLISNNNHTYSLIDAVTADKQNNFIMGFSNLIKEPATQNELRLSKVSKDGEYIWGESGVIISPMSENLMAFGVLAADSKGDIYAAANTASGTGGKLYKIDGKTGNIIKSINSNVSSMVMDKNDNLYVAYSDVPNRLNLQIYNTDLIAKYAEAAQVSTGNVDGPSKILLDPSGGVWVCYYSNLYHFTFFVQYLDGNLIPRIGLDGVAVSNNPARYRLNGWPVIIPEEETLAFAFSEVVSGGEVFNYIKAQKIKKDGTLLMTTEGTDIIPSSKQSLDAMGLYNTGSKLALNYRYYQGSGSTLRTNSAIAFFDMDFSNPEKLEYSLSDYDYVKYVTEADNYGIYSVWTSRLSGSESNQAIKAQHVNFDRTLPNKPLSIQLATNNIDYGYATGGGLFNNGDSAIVEAVTIKDNPANQFVEWQIDGIKVSEENPYKFEVTKNATLVAIFKQYNSIEEDIALTSPIISPNPAKAGAALSLHNVNIGDIKRVSIHDLSGHTLMDAEANINMILKAPNTSGAYILKITTNEGTYKVKMLVR